MPEQGWTLLLQGVDRYIDEIHQLIQQFDFIPRWRFDDVMISYAPTGGSVGQFAEFVTKLDPADMKIIQTFEYYNSAQSINLHPACKTAYIEKNGKIQHFINGEIL